MNRPSRAARQPAHSPVSALRKSAVMPIDQGDEPLDQDLAEWILGRLGPGPIAGQDDQERRENSGCHQLIGSFIRAQAVPLVVVVILPMDQIKHRVAPIDLLFIACRQVDGVFQGQF